MSRKSLTALLLALCMVLSACPVFAANTAKEPLVFSDVPETHWAHKFVSEMTAMGLFSGTSTPVNGVGTFSPDKTMSRAEFLTVTVNQLYGSDFAKMQPASPWYKNTYDLAVSKGLITASEFTLNDMQYGMSRQEMAMIVVRAMDVMGNTSTKKLMSQSRIPDYDYIREYYKVYVQKCYANGCIGGTDSKGTFNPWGVLTRAQASVVLYHLIVPESRGHYDESMLVDVPAYAYLTDCRLVINGAVYPGLVKIKDEYYMPLPTIEEYINRRTDAFSINVSEDNTGLEINVYPIKTYGYDGLYAVWNVADKAVGKCLGLAQPIDGKVTMYEEMTRFETDAYTLGGGYPMVNVKAFGPGSFVGKDYVTKGYMVDIYGESYANKKPVTDNSSAIAATLIKGTDKETVTAIHDYIINQITYGYAEHDDGTDLENNVTLKEKRGVCEDYTRLFHSMCNVAGIPCVDVIGATNGEGHAWNEVYIDGKWQYVDCTWDDPIGGKPRKSYLLVNAETLAIDHFWYEGVYHTQMYKPDDYPALPEFDPAWCSLDPMKVNSREMFRKVLAAQIYMGKESFSIKCPSGCFSSLDFLAYYELMPWAIKWSYNSKTGCYDYKLGFF